MNPLLLLGLGAAAMYYLDPEQGPRRRAQAREQLIKARDTVRERASGMTAGKKAEPRTGDPLAPPTEPPSQSPESSRHLGR
jgi:hypothetical protein